MNREEKNNLVPVWERATITLEEAAAYTGIGVRKLREMTDEPTCDYVMWVGNRRMIKRRKLDEYLICTPFTGHPVEGVLLCGTHMSTKGNV